MTDGRTIRARGTAAGGRVRVDASTLYAMAPKFAGEKARAQAAIIDAIGPVLAPTLADYAITTPIRVAMFLAQICHESAGFRTTEEFASGAAYEGRASLGNTEPGDGRRYKGRGLIQLTGRANYARFGSLLGIDLIADPERAAEPVLSLRIACEYWRSRDINAPADRGDIRSVTRRINGGLNGLAERRRYFVQAGMALDECPSVREFQAGAGIAVDGIVGPQTCRAMAGRLRTTSVPVPPSKPAPETPRGIWGLILDLIRAIGRLFGG